ncbi:MAG TPA: glycosyltransferase family 4 protein [Burkholderiales bacterium]
MKTICVVVSTLMTARAFLLDQLAALSKSYIVVVAANATDPEALQKLGIRVPVIFVPIERRISPLRDLWALLCLVRHFRRHRFDVVHSVTPKAGLLAMAAAWLVRVPVRIHIFTGQVWVTRKRLAGALLRSVDRLIARLATHVLVDSRSQCEFLIENRVVPASKATVLANGSICGVDGERFRPDAAARRRIRGAIRVPEDAVVFLYLGRLSRDKGVQDLALAFTKLAERHVTVHLALVGPEEDGLRRHIEEAVVPRADRVRIIDYTDRPEDYMAAADVFCLPSYREGFGQVALEAAAAGLPVIASRIYGIVDAVAEGETGLLHLPADVEGLRTCMETLLAQPDLRRRLGTAGRARALQDFSAARVTQALLEYYAGIAAKL